jgi:hypothetical protein
MAECKWKTFEEFANCAFGYWKITVDKEANESNWKSSTCTCPIYFKQYICKHIIGVCILLKIVKPPGNAKDCPIGQVRPPGRPRLAAAGLCRQRQFTSLLEDLEDLEEEDVNEEDENVVQTVGDAFVTPDPPNLIINHNFEHNDYSDYVAPKSGRYPDDQFPIETNDSNYGSESNLDSCSSTIHFAGINHISNINFDQNAFLHDPHSHTAYSNSTGVNFDFNSSNSHQSFSTTKTFSTLTNVNLSSLAHISNNELQFNAVNNYSMNLSTYQPQIDSEDEDEVEDNVVKEVVE